MHFALPILISLLVQNSPEGKSVHDLLASNDFAQLAWGAEMAARSERSEYVPALRNLLACPDDRVKEQILDALIRLNAKIPPEELMPLPPTLRDQQIILAIRNKNLNILAFLLAQSPTHDATWVALNEGLVESGAGPAYWRQLLSSWTIHVVIYVIDPGNTPVIEPPSGGGACGDSVSEIRSGFPARATYRLYIDPQPGDIALTTRPNPIYYRRASNPSGCDTLIDRNNYRGDFIAFAAGVYPPMKTHYRHDIAWAGDRSYIAQVGRLRNDLLSGYQKMLNGMVTRRILAPEDAALRPHIDIRIEDQRSKKPRQLPATPPWR